MRFGVEVEDVIVLKREPFVGHRYRLVAWRKWSRFIKLVETRQRRELYHLFGALALNNGLGAEAIEELQEFRIPQYGSPPSDWKQLGTITSSITGVVATGVTIADNHPVLGVITATTCVIVYFVKPTVDELRMGLAEAVHRKVRRDPPPRTLDDDNPTEK